jgi:hypothetical protein
VTLKHPDDKSEVEEEEDAEQNDEEENRMNLDS